MRSNQRFSKRHNYYQAVHEKKITIHEDAPEQLRRAVVEIAEETGFSPHKLIKILCRRLREDPTFLSFHTEDIYPNALRLVSRCEWFYVYDIAEDIYHAFTDKKSADYYQDELNLLFRRGGIGWQMIDGVIQTRGPEAFESTIKNAVHALETSGRPTASNEIHNALRDLSNRPAADLTGAVHHAMAALECVARDVSRTPKATLGDILKKHLDLVPSPLGDALSKVWGYASEMGRHVREGRTPTREEAELLVGLSAAVATYLAKKFSRAK